MHSTNYKVNTLHTRATVTVEAPCTKHLHVMVLTVGFTLTQHELVTREGSLTGITQEVLRRKHFVRDGW